MPRTKRIRTGYTTQSEPTSSQVTVSSQKKKKGTLNFKPVAVFLGRQPFPKQLYNTLKYVQSNVATQSGGLSKQVFSCNGLFDPDFTGTGHQPMFFDTLMGIYDHYHVIRSRIKCTICFAASTTATIISSLYIDDDTTTTTNSLISLEQVTAKGGVIRPGGISPVCYLSASWDAKKAFGANVLSDPELQGTVAANPQEQQFFVIQNLDSGGGATIITTLYEIEYDVVWDEFITQPQQ